MHCPTHGVKQIAVPWANPGSQFTAWFERLALDVLRECSVKGAAGLLRLTWDEAWGIKARGLRRRTQDVVAHLGVDEKAIAKRHRDLTVVADLERGRVLYWAEDRQQESVDGFWGTLTPEQRGRLRPSRWTCGSLTSSRPRRTSMGPRPRSSSISFMWPSLSTRLWTGCGGRNTGGSSRLATDA
ncbi:MAG: DDE transposase [Nitrospirae bacterium]|nr:MAG: DDE transposase [Nitrospirota bacterium]